MKIYLKLFLTAVFWDGIFAKVERTGEWILKSRLFLPILILTIIGAVIAGFVGFFWRHNQPLPENQLVEDYFEKEIAVLEDLAGEIDPSKLSVEEPALPDLDQVSGISPVIPSLDPIHEVISRIREVEKQLSDTEVLTAKIHYRSQDSNSNVTVFYDESLNIWSPDFIFRTEFESEVSYCYSGLRQLVQYRKMISSENGRTASIQLVFPMEIFQR